MAEQKKPVGRARLAELLSKLQKPEGLSSAGTSGATACDWKQDVSVTEEVPKKKRIGRGDFIAQMRAQVLMEKRRESETAESTTSSERSVAKFSEIEDLSGKLRETKLRDEKEDTGSELKVMKKQGEFGEKRIFSTNYVRLKTNPNKPVFEYEIRFQPDVVNVSYRFRLLYRQFHEIREMLCYDGGSKLFTPEQITNDVIRYSLKHPIDDAAVIMSIKFKKIAIARDCAVLYNILFKNFSRVLSMTRFRNKYYDHRAALKIPQHKLEIWPGVVTAVDDFDGGIQLRCDINHRILRTETAHDIIASLIRRNPQNFKALVEKELLGECVLTRYNNNLYRIDDIEWSQSPTSSFELSHGQSITFLEYYKKQYNIQIRDAKQPLLISRRKNERGEKSRLICLVPELCNMTGLTDKMCSDVKVMKDVAVYTRVTPAQRAYAFRKFLNNIKSNEEAQEMLHKWGLTIDDEPMTAEGRNLLSERLVFGKGISATAVNGDWQKCLREVTVYRSVDLVNWFVLFPERDVRISTSFTNLLRKVGPGLGIEISEPNMIALRDDRNETYINAMRKHIDRRIQMVVCICPTAREDRYSVIKKFCCKEVPVPSQVINTITLAREDRLRAVVQNVALQMNVKLGGASWAIHVPFKNTMICGVDTYHDKGNGTSVGGFVASCSETYTEWFSKTVFQGPKEEIIEGLINSFSSALKNYREKLKQYPERIVVYRDGLSDGQLEICRDFEVAQFLQACKEINHGINPKFTFVVVRKRIATKMFQLPNTPRRFLDCSKRFANLEAAGIISGKRMNVWSNPKIYEGNDSSKVVNPTPGDIIDGTITRKLYYDFFLVSQFVRAGTATPCHYIVLYDNSNMKPDHMQRLTYKFCHLYYNWPGTIRVPAPCYYAHKLAYLVGQSVRTVPDKSLENKLYYL